MYMIWKWKVIKVFLKLIILRIWVKDDIGIYFLIYWFRFILFGFIVFCGGFWFCFLYGYIVYYY